MFRLIFFTSKVRDVSTGEEKNATCDSLKDKVDPKLEVGIGIDDVVENCKLDTVLDPVTKNSTLN